ncbi:unnamed protein product [marine sediment metagenome]|uniref:Uncharacterized protein n=1 Tax=marine sediment metagenome TaxID=412755 RepID=X1VGQ0_9ZZZZ
MSLFSTKPYYDKSMLEELAKDVNHKILVEKLAFLIHHLRSQNWAILRIEYGNEAVEKWNKDNIKNTPYGKRLFKLAEEFSKIKLKED